MLGIEHMTLWFECTVLTTMVLSRLHATLVMNVIGAFVTLVLSLEVIVGNLFS